jgi:hypothetical protein
MSFDNKPEESFTVDDIFVPIGRGADPTYYADNFTSEQLFDYIATLNESVLDAKTKVIQAQDELNELKADLSAAQQAIGMTKDLGLE